MRSQAMEFPWPDADLPASFGGPRDHRRLPRNVVDRGMSWNLGMREAVRALPGAPDLELLHPGPKGAGLEPQDGRRPLAPFQPPLGCLEHLEDVLSLDLLER